MNKIEFTEHVIDIIFLTDLHIYQLYLGGIIFVLGWSIQLVNIIKANFFFIPYYKKSTYYTWGDTRMFFPISSDTKEEKKNKLFHLKWLFIAFIILNIGITLMFSSVCFLIYFNFFLIYKYAKKYYEVLLVKYEDALMQFMGLTIFYGLLGLSLLGTILFIIRLKVLEIVFGIYL